MTRLAQRRYDPHSGYSLDQGRELAALSRLISRQIALLIDRQGRIEYVIVGTATGVLIPTLPRERSSGRLRGMRLLHTHLGKDFLSREDLMDMLFLRLDSVSVLTVDEFGLPDRFQTAHLLPGELEEKRPVREAEESDAAHRRALPQLEESEPYRLSPIVPWDALEQDFQAEAEALEQEFARIFDAAHQTAVSTAVKNQSGEQLQSGARSVLVSISKQPKALQEIQLAELAELARTAGLSVAGSLMQRVTEIHPRHILSETKLAELEVIALQGHAAIIIFDGELTPAQLQSLAELTERKVLDRTQLILDIFAQHATSKAGKLQVEMAQLKYMLPRLVGKNRAMDRLMGGIGGRGPGETKLETDRRRVRDRIARIRGELDNLKKQRACNRARRAKTDLPVAALVGYTNAGKSTLLNQLTNADVLTENKLFATLDPTTRRLRFPQEKELVLADTVGFIRDLPKELMEAFRATLEELNEADLLIHVVDASHPEMDRQLEAVENILIDLKLHEVPRLLLLNKWDVLSPESRSAIAERFPEAIPVSGLTGAGLDKASRWIEKKLF